MIEQSPKIFVSFQFWSVVRLVKKMVKPIGWSGGRSAKWPCHFTILSLPRSGPIKSYHPLGQKNNPFTPLGQKESPHFQAYILLISCWHTVDWRLLSLPEGLFWRTDAALFKPSKRNTQWCERTTLCKECIVHRDLYALGRTTLYAPHMCKNSIL